jgi:hypothetical protein
MRKDLKKFIREYEICQQNKYENTSPAVLLQPLPIPTQIWSDISMDFIEGLPLSHGHSMILVVVDRLSKYNHFFFYPYHIPILFLKFLSYSLLTFLNFMGCLLLLSQIETQPFLVLFGRNFFASKGLLYNSVLVITLKLTGKLRL